MHKKIKHFGFTLIEMLIVIVIIGILAAALVPRLQDVQGRARDTKRKADLLQITNALAIYKIDQGVYPRPRNAANPGGDYNVNTSVTSRSAQPWIIELSGHMTSIPIDPKNDGSWRLTGNYEYLYNNVIKSGNGYSLLTRLENKKDPDRCELMQYQWYIQAVAYPAAPTLFTCSAISCAGGYECGQLYFKNDNGP